MKAATIETTTRPRSMPQLVGDYTVGVWRSVGTTSRHLVTEPFRIALARPRATWSSISWATRPAMIAREFSRGLGRSVAVEPQALL